MFRRRRFGHFFASRGTPATPAATPLRAWRIAKRVGLRYVYTGNVHHPESQRTHCHGCGAVLIGRDRYDFTVRRLAPDGRCRSCGRPCAGVFDGAPEHRGRRRRPLSLERAALGA